MNDVIETRVIRKADLDRLIEQVDQLSEGRIERNAEIKRLREAVHAALGYISADIDRDKDGNAWRLCQQLREALG